MFFLLFYYWNKTWWLKTFLILGKQNRLSKPKYLVCISCSCFINTELYKMKNVTSCSTSALTKKKSQTPWIKSFLVNEIKLSKECGNITLVVSFFSSEHEVNAGLSLCSQLCLSQIICFIPTLRRYTEILKAHTLYYKLCLWWGSRHQPTFNLSTAGHKTNFREQANLQNSHLKKNW